jgi:hypothetical protein
LSNILTAYTQIDKQTGYGQGMNAIAAFILNCKQKTKFHQQLNHEENSQIFDEVGSFYMFVFLMH